jgi:hypothetical protein
MSKFTDILGKVLELFKAVIPWIAAWVYNAMSSKIKRQEIELESKDLEIKKEQGHDEIDKRLDAKSDADIVRDAIRKGSTK